MIAHANGNALAEKLAAIQRYDLCGWMMTPCRTRGKEPYRPNWQKERLNLEEITDLIADNPFQNLGVLTGEISGGLVCIDLDNPIAVELADQYLPPTPLVVGRGENPRTHWFYHVPGGIKATKFKLPADPNDKEKKLTVVEVLGDGNQVIVGPSVHPSGDLYDLLDGEPATVDGAELLEAAESLFNAVLDRLGLIPQEKPKPNSNNRSQNTSGGSGLSPGKDFDDRGDVRELLQRHGWTRIDNSGNDERWRRPGKDHGVSASLKDGRLFHCFTSSAAGVDSGKGYGPFGLFTALEFGGDFHQAHEKLKTLGFGNSLDSQYAPEDWREPIPLGPDAVAEFPIDAIPSQVQGYLTELSEFCQTPFDLAAGMWLAATGVALQKKFVVEPSRGWIEPLNVYVLALMDPANRKSAVVAAIARPIRLFEETQSELLGPTIRAARSAHEIRTKQRQRLVDEAAKTPMGSDRDAVLHEVQSLDEEIANNPVPAEPRLLADDITPEHLATRMSQNNGRLGVLTAEGDLFDIMSGRYSAKGQPNIGIFLKSHAGDEVRIDRGNRPSEFIRSPALSIGCCVQPEVMRGLMQQKSFRGRGLLGRFLYQLPESLLGHRKTSPAEVNPMTESDYTSIMRKLLDLPVRQNGNGEFIPEVLKLGRNADDLFRSFREEIETTLGEFGIYATIKDWAGKLPGAVARIAGLMHIVEHVEHKLIPTGISGGTIQNAIRLGQYFASHATSVFQIMGRDDSVALAEHIVHTIQRHDMRVFSKSDVHQKVRRRVDTPDELDGPLKLLVDHNFIRHVPQASTGPGRKPSPAYETNPKLTGKAL